jgi:hypothetical protein
LQYFDANGRPRWHEIARCCLQHRQHLRQSEIGFVTQMAHQPAHWELSEKQAKWLTNIFVRLGGNWANRPQA